MTEINLDKIDHDSNMKRETEARTIERKEQPQTGVKMPLSLKIMEGLFLIVWAVPIVFTAILLLSGMSFTPDETTFLRTVLIVFSVYEGGWFCLFFNLRKVRARKAAEKGEEDG